MRRFTSHQQDQRFLSMHGLIHNFHVPQHKHDVKSKVVAAMRPPEQTGAVISILITWEFAGVRAGLRCKIPTCPHYTIVSSREG
jgi:hypothetical protein